MKAKVYVTLKPSVLDPQIYDGSENYKIAPKLQDCLKDVIKKANFRPIKVALVDLTKGRMQPEFAGSFNRDYTIPVEAAGCGSALTTGALSGKVPSLGGMQ